MSLMKYFFLALWTELKPALIIYGVIIAGAWALITANNQFNLFS
jgi:hypothetical protein